MIIAARISQVPHTTLSKGRVFKLATELLRLSITIFASYWNEKLHAVHYLFPGFFTFCLQQANNLRHSATSGNSVPLPLTAETKGGNILFKQGNMKICYLHIIKQISKNSKRIL
jgi:hypothetical protein